MIVVGLFVGVFARREHYLRIDWCAEGSSVGIDVKQWNVNILRAGADCSVCPQHPLASRRPRRGAKPARGGSLLAPELRVCLNDRATRPC
jgi:hypothetical protein